MTESHESQTNISERSRVFPGTSAAAATCDFNKVQGAGLISIWPAAEDGGTPGPGVVGTHIKLVPYQTCAGVWANTKSANKGNLLLADAGPAFHQSTRYYLL